MTARWIEALTGSLEQKKQYRSAKARIEAVAEPHRTAATAMHRYFLYYGGVADGDVLVRMLTDLADLWERAEIDRTPVSAIVGDDPVDFAKTFAQAYGGTHWIDKERTRLTDAIDEAKRKERS